ncbi:MAG: disulfide bond formation protein B [Alcaligenaceae bacterium]|jgi:disulfide bond formation protein DsbB|nr:disulfide bond formation protein B [Alcaligenaceae bacterium]
MKLSQRQLLNLIAFLCLASVVFALFSQHVLGMLPCAWCVLQRLIFLLIAAVCLLVNFSSSIIYQKALSLIAAALSISGIIAAWYQYSVASISFSCDMTFADIFMSRQTGLDAAVPWLFGIYATCMDAAVSLFGIEYAIWALLLFAFIAILLILNLFRKS